MVTVIVACAADILFTNNVNNGVINRDNNNHGLNDKIRHALITQYFAKLLLFSFIFTTI